MVETAGEAQNLHGTAVALGEHAVLIRGRSGAGKSDLALRCLGLAPGPLVALQPMLVADDRVLATQTADGVHLSAPPMLAGLLEVRGIGILHVPSTAGARLALIADLMAPAAIERLPEPDPPETIGSFQVARLRITPFEASAPLKLMLALAAAAGIAHFSSLLGRPP